MNRASMLLGSLATLLLACNDPARCVEVSRPPVTDPSTALVIGGTYGDALATVVGARSGTVRWNDGQSQVEGFPAPGEAGITVTIHEPSMAEQIDLEREGGAGERLFCPDSLRAELEVELRSDDGSLDAVVMAEAEFDDPMAATITADVSDRDLGMITFEPADPEASLRLRLTYVSGSTAEGALVLVSGGATGEGSGEGSSIELATWSLE